MQNKKVWTEKVRVGPSEGFFGASFFDLDRIHPRENCTENHGSKGSRKVQELLSPKGPSLHGARELKPLELHTTRTRR